MEGRVVGSEEEGLRGEGVKEGRGVNDGTAFRRSGGVGLVGYLFNCGVKVGGIGMSYPFRGTAIFAATRPVSALAIFTMLSVPAENNCSPSVLKAKLLQLPLCRFVRQGISMALVPF